MLPLRKLLVPSGRASRREFWSYALALLIAVAVIVVVMRVAAPQLIVPLFLPVLCLEYFALWAVAVRRLHDTNRGGDMLLVAVIPVIGLVVLLWLATESDPNTNRFGPKPRG